LKKIGINQQQTAGGQRLMRQAAVALAMSLALGAGQVSAMGNGNGKGPRASVLSETRCALDLGDVGSGEADLVITTTLTNKSSGNVIAELRPGLYPDVSKIEGTFKQKTVRGNIYYSLDGEVLIDDLPADVDPPLSVSATYDLCVDAAENVAISRELNGKATMQYGISGGEGETRTVVNRCTDDPDTEEDNEGGIKVDDVTFSEIATACGWPQQY